jgi:hypothetical protein
MAEGPPGLLEIGSSSGDRVSQADPDCDRFPDSNPGNKLKFREPGGRGS